MTGAVGRLVARSARPALAVGRPVIGASIVELDHDDEWYRRPEPPRLPEPAARPHPMSVEPLPDPAEVATPTRAAVFDPPHRAAASPNADTSPMRPTAAIAPADAAPALSGDPVRHVTSPPGGRPPTIRPHDEARREQTRSRSQRTHPPARGESPSQSDGEPAASPNPIGRRLERAAAERLTATPAANVEPHDEPHAPSAAPAATVRPRTRRSSEVPTVAAPERVETSAHRPTPSLVSTPVPSVTIGTIEVVTPAAAAPAPAPLAALAARRRSGRARWTGRAR